MTTIIDRPNSATDQHGLIGPTGRRPIDPISWEIGQAFLQGMLLEVSAWPKPGLVCPGSNGAHTDMSIRTFMVGSSAIAPALVLCAQSGRDHAGGLPSLLPELRWIGVKYEKGLLKATKLVNTQRGILFAAGLLCGAAGYLSRTSRSIEPDSLFDAVSAMCQGLVRRELVQAGLETKPNPTAGEQLYLKYGAPGIRGEVERGFPTVRKVGLPSLAHALEGHCTTNMAMVHCLLSLMAHAEDTTILWRKGKETLDQVHADAQEALDLGSVFKASGIAKIFALDDAYKNNNISPGGCADLLAVSIGTYILAKGTLPGAIM